MNKKIPLAIPNITDTDIDAVVKVLRSGWLTHGEYNLRFEEAVCDLIGVQHAVVMNSCASALEVALVVAGITGEVIVPTFTFVASANAILAAGATPVFCDVDIVTRNVRACDIEPFITSRTEAVMVVHFAGQPCNMDAICALCDKYHLLLVEDSAETLGATWKGQGAGSFGLGCFSFFPTKNITTGEGGMLTCRDAKIADQARAYIGHGIPSWTLARETKSVPWQREAIVAGRNYRMSNLLAALGYHQTLRLSDMNHRRQLLAARYNQRIHKANIPVTTPAIADGATHVFQMYTIQVAPELRNQLVIALKACGIGASVHFDPPVHRHAFYQSFCAEHAEFYNADLLSRCLITLPLYPAMAIEDVDYVVDSLVSLIEK